MIQAHYIQCTLYLHYYYISSISDHQALDLQDWERLSRESLNLMRQWKPLNFSQLVRNTDGLETPKLAAGVQNEKSVKVMFDSLQLHGLQPARLLCPYNSPGKNTGMGSHFHLQWIFLTQGSNRSLLYCRKIPHHLSHQGGPIVCGGLLIIAETGCGLYGNSLYNSSANLKLFLKVYF